ncbi:hypothetical protein [Flammeovirga sp. EKP202]|uniref:hypothetical protein n=1 Tax=Flammeovirga sp. EKP202 TaxID=2770592 RepID=UPI00165ED753|nr:hypothetical protein [Flammeovirga sp. EKP202]MBD0401164.1 hypothetical protein [Flammeovirga sp. EKP202]
MKQLLKTALLFLLLSPVYGQKSVDIPQTKVVEVFMDKLPSKLEAFNLKDLRSSGDAFNVRIWQQHSIFTLNDAQTSSSEYKLHTTSHSPVYTTTAFSNELTADLIAFFKSSEVMQLQNDNTRGIDGSFVYIEIATKEKYKVVSYWSPKASRNKDCKSVVALLDNLYSKVNYDDLVHTFLNSLEPGGYTWGMSTLRIDRFLGDDIEKTDFYNKVEGDIKEQLSVSSTTNRWEYPLVMINGELSKIADLNQYSLEEVKKFDIMKSNAGLQAIYGTSAKHGVVILDTI